jgi:hypothetical protein
MQSTDIPGLSVWVKWSSGSLKLAPDSPGIYVLRMESRRAIERLVGSSDIVYIGCSADSTVRSRLTNHYQTNGSFKRVLKEVGEMELSWRCFKTDHEERLWESDLIAQYERKHIELPPLNRSQPWATLQAAKTFMKSELPSALYKSIMETAFKGGFPLEMSSGSL